MSNHRPDYPERVIASLPEEWQRFMALCALEGWRIKCGPMTQAGNRWWQVHTPSGMRTSGIGGLELQRVLQRLANSMEREKQRGLLATQDEGAKAQLDHQPGPQAGAARVHGRT